MGQGAPAPRADPRRDPPPHGLPSARRRSRLHRNGRRIAGFRTTWRKACEAAGLGSRLWHDMRRSGCRNMIRAAVPQNVAQRVSRHLTASILARYNVVDEDDIEQAVERTATYVAQRSAKVARLPQNSDRTRIVEPVPKTAECGAGR